MAVASTSSDALAHGSNLRNALIAVTAPLPSILFYLSFLRQSNSLSPLYIWCYHHPLLLAFTLFFLDISLLFWVVGLLQNSHWMIDLYWTEIPVMLVYYFSSHPLAESNVWRSRLVIFLTSVWCIRLSHSYLRRERWQFGAREDWRFTDMRQQYGENWWWASLLSIYLSHQVFLLGSCLPLYVVHSKNKQLNIWDFAAALVCLAGVTIAYFADTQLHHFVIRNDRLKQLGQPLVPILDEGLWHYSRHPNYFGEQLWWWGLVIFAWNLGCGWTFFGALMNSLCLAYVTILVEQRMAKPTVQSGSVQLLSKGNIGLDTLVQEIISKKGEGNMIHGLV